ncbi:MAG: hypothetical protein HZC24_14860 [Rhodocyclales bacterium]|nr:hypothetical protein [Rhodocyclales bacterium]
MARPRRQGEPHADAGMVVRGGEQARHRAVDLDPVEVDAVLRHVRLVLGRMGMQQRQQALQHGEQTQDEVARGTVHCRD